MKKYLLLTLVLCISISSFAAPWDIKSPKINVKKWTQPFSDPYCDFYIGTVTGTWPAQTFNLQATLDHSTHVTWLVQIQVFGIWYGEPGYPNAATYKTFDIIYNPGQWNKTINYKLKSSEEAYPGVMDLIYDGPY